jgi:hypothetical protein
MGFSQFLDHLLKSKPEAVEAAAHKRCNEQDFF